MNAPMSDGSERVEPATAEGKPFDLNSRGSGLAEEDSTESQADVLAPTGSRMDNPTLAPEQAGTIAAGEGPADQAPGDERMRYPASDADPRGGRDVDVDRNV
jgi:hypothetical protein